MDKKRKNDPTKIPTRNIKEVIPEENPVQALTTVLEKKFGQIESSMNQMVNLMENQQKQINNLKAKPQSNPTESSGKPVGIGGLIGEAMKFMNSPIGSKMMEGIIKMGGGGATPEPIAPPSDPFIDEYKKDFAKHRGLQTQMIEETVKSMVLKNKMAEKQLDSDL